VAAVNSVSDVYAMGGRPLFALNVLCWNATELPGEVLEEVVEGAAEVAAECGFVIAGGHTVDDPEPKFGLSVVGEAHPDRLLRNSGLRPGDRLILTKAIGTGVISTAAKAGVAPPEATDAMLASMFRTNEEAAQVALDCGAEGATDVTGFGLLGHLALMAQASGADVTVDVRSVPLMPGVGELAAAGHVPGGSRRNLEWIGELVDLGATDPDTVLLLADAQTSGGLLFGIDPGRAPAAVARLSASGHTCAQIGNAEPGSGKLRLR
jgi:selenide,water dikinase